MKTKRDVMMAKEVSRLLGFNVKTIYEAAKRGELPCLKVGREFRFSRKRIMDLLEGRTKQNRRKQ